MSRLFDAKQQALSAYPDDRESAVEMFIGYIDADVCDIEYEVGTTIEKYIFGDEESS